MRYLMLALLLAVAVANTAAPGPTEPTIPDVPQRAWTAVSCDERDRAYDVEPDTPDAWREAQEWCTQSGRDIAEMPWPGGMTPTNLPTG